MNFSESAHNKLMTNFPEIGKLVVSFRDMKGDIDDKSTTDLGVFILKAGEKYYYVPVIAQSGTVYPIDSVFDAQEKKFFPLSKNTLTRLTEVQATNMGKTVRTPTTVDRNPSVQDLVVPPKTGKHVYASSGRLPEFLATVPNEIKSFMLEKIASDMEFARDLNKVYGISEILEPLKKQASVPIVTAKSEEISAKVITEGRGHSEEVIQDILDKGYSIQGETANPRVAILSDLETYSKSFTEVGGVVPGQAYSVVFKDGTTRDALVPPSLPRQNEGGNGFMGRTKHDTLQYMLFSNGDYVGLASKDRFIIQANPVSYKAVMANLLEHKGSLKLRDVESGTKYAIFDGSKLLGVFYVDQAISQDGFLNLAVREDGFSNGAVRNIQVESGFNGPAFHDGGILIACGECTAIPIGSFVYKDRLETSMTSACRRKEFQDARVLESSMTINCDKGVYAADNKVVGGKPDMIRILVVKKRILPAAAESFVKAAEERGHAKILMSKQAMYGNGTRPAPIPEYGEKPEPATPISGSKADRQRGASVSAAKTALKTGDKQVVDATLISELLQDPDLHDTIESYLPDIEEAIDKIGRILLVTRMRVDDLSDKMNSGGLTELLTSLRNTYRTLGDNYVKLESLSSDVTKDT